MTKKDLVEEIKQNMPEGLTNLEKARYVYIELGKQRRFSPLMYYGNRKQKDKILRDARNVKNINNKRTLICITLTRLYNSILNELGIESKTAIDIDSSNQNRWGRNGWSDHRYSEITMLDEDGKQIRIRADLVEDLNRIQSGRSTTEFGTTDIDHTYYDEIDEEMLKTIDQKIGYIQEDYRDIEVLKSELQGLNATEALKSVLEDTRIFSDTHFQGHMERRTYYVDTLKTLLNQYLDDKIYIFTCYKKREEKDSLGINKRNFTICTFSYEDDVLTPYMYSIPLGKFQQVSVEQLSEFRDKGLVFGTKPNTPGVNIIKRAMDKKKREKDSSAQDAR